ncbi:MAG: hypothetical protein Q9166_001159 [cf. Caloplaca sp. 2 TL-2023]
MADNVAFSSTMRQVSIVVPSFNSGLYLRDCVSSIQENTAGVEVEVIIVDDGSTDETSLRVISDLDSEPDLKIIRHENNLGVQFARNTGLKAAGGDYVLCMDADDVLLPISEHESFLSEATRILSAKPEVAFVHTMSRMFGDFRGLTISSYPLREQLVARKHHVPIYIVYRRNEISNGLLHIETVPKWQDWAFGASLLARRWARKESSEIRFVEGPGELQVSEPSWNVKVYGPSLQLALECSTVHGETNAKDKTVDWDIISTARISSNEEWYNMLPDAVAGLTTETRKVDFAILHLCSNEQKRRLTTKSILNYNHASEPSLRMRSIAINIENKTLRGSYDEAERQLGIWVDNQFRTCEQHSARFPDSCLCSLCEMKIGTF